MCLQSNIDVEMNPEIWRNDVKTVFIMKAYEKSPRPFAQIKDNSWTPRVNILYLLYFLTGLINSRNRSLAPYAIGSKNNNRLTMQYST